MPAHCRHTWLNVIPMYCDVIVPVCSLVLVVEAEGVEKLVHDGSVPRDAAVGQRHALRPANHSDVRRAPVKVWIKHNSTFNRNYVIHTRGVSTVQKVWGRKNFGSRLRRSQHFTNFTYIENYGAKTPPKQFMC